jgi:hypothetical protein
VRSFTVKAAPTAPGLNSPGDGSETCDTTPYFTWNGLSGATSYQIEVDNDPGFNSPEVQHTTSGTSHTAGSLSSDTYYWRVRAQNTCGWGSWSSTWSFTIPDTVNPPDLYAPGQGSDTCDTTPTFDWSDMAGATLYEIEVDNNSNLGSPEIEASASTSQYTPGSPLAQDRYYWRVRTYSSCGYGIWSDVHSFDVVGVPPVAAHITPADGSEQCNANLSFDWSAQWATSYHLRVDNNPSFGSPEIAVTTSNSWYSSGDSLSPGTYYWKVWAENECGSSGWSSPWSFTLVEPAAAPILTAPPQGRVLCDTTPTFNYYVSTWGETVYRLQVDDSGSFSSPNRDITTPESTYTLGQPLASPDYWYWQVQAENACGTGPWSSSWFRLTTNAPATPALSSPGHGSAVCDATPTFTWAVVDWTSWYEIQVDDDTGFGSPAIDDTASLASYTAQSPLLSGDYHWRVRACNDCGCGEWSAAWDLTVRTTPEATSLRDPDEDTTTYDNTPYFQWFSVSGAEEYRFELDDDPGFGSPDDVQITYEPDRSYQAGTMADGVYFWRVQASNACGPGSWSEVWRLTIDTACHTPHTVDKTAPPNGGQTCDLRPTFEWEAESEATSYRIQLDNNGSAYDFGSPVIDTTTSDPSYTPGTALAPDIYFWRVRPCNECGCNDWSSAWDVEVGPPWAPLLDDPVDGSIWCYPFPAHLDWDSVEVATSYEVQVNDSPAFGSPLIHETLSQSGFWPDPRLPEGIWYWRARGCNDCGCGAWSDPWVFTVGPPGSAPALTSPADGLGLCTATPTLTWSPVSGTEWYELEVDTDSGFPSPGIDTTTPATEYTPLAALPFGTFYWRVQAHNACGSSGWSEYRSLNCADCMGVYLPVVLRVGP